MLPNGRDPFCGGEFLPGHIFHLYSAHSGSAATGAGVLVVLKKRIFIFPGGALLHPRLARFQKYYKIPNYAAWIARENCYCTGPSTTRSFLDVLVPAYKRRFANGTRGLNRTQNTLLGNPLPGCYWVIAGEGGGGGSIWRRPPPTTPALPPFSLEVT